MIKLYKILFTVSVNERLEQDRIVTPGSDQAVAEIEPQRNIRANSALLAFHSSRLGQDFNVLRSPPGQTMVLHKSRGIRHLSTE